MHGLANELVDRERSGDWWIADREAYPTWWLGSSETLSAFEFFGAVRLRVRPGRVVVAWHIDYSDDRSLAVAMDNLARLAQPRRVRLHYFKSGWSREDHANPAAAIARMQALEAFRGVSVPPRTLIRPQRLRDLKDADPVIREAFAAWYRQRDAWDWAETRPGRHGLLFRPEDGELKFTHVGPQSECRRLLGSAWRAGAIGTGCDDAFDDADFNRRTSTAFYRTHDSREPIFDHVLAHMAFGTRDIWLPYQRVVLPTSDGVAVVTRVTPRIDISLFGRAPV
ncbi:MAG: hypothetical protein ACFCUQ_12880 [Kiloniellales bacterium]